MFERLPFFKKPEPIHPPSKSEEVAPERELERTTTENKKQRVENADWKEFVQDYYELDNPELERHIDELRDRLKNPATDGGEAENTPDPTPENEPANQAAGAANQTPEQTPDPEQPPVTPEIPDVDTPETPDDGNAEQPPVDPEQPEVPMSPEEVKLRLQAAEKVYLDRIKVDIRDRRELSPRQRAMVIRNITEHGERSALGELFIANQGFKNWDDALRKFDVKDYIVQGANGEQRSIVREDKTLLDRMPRFLRDRVKDAAKGGAVTMATMGIVALFGGAVSLPIALGALGGSLLGKGIADLAYRNRKLYGNSENRKSLGYAALGSMMDHVSIAQQIALQKIEQLDSMELSDEDREMHRSAILNELVEHMYRRDFEKVDEFRKVEGTAKKWEIFGSAVGGLAGSLAAGVLSHGADSASELAKARTDGIRVSNGHFTTDPSQGHVVRMVDGEWRYAIEPKDLQQVQAIYNQPYVANYNYLLPGTGQGQMVTSEALQSAAANGNVLHWLGTLSAPQQAAAELATRNALWFGGAMNAMLLAGEGADVAVGALRRRGLRARTGRELASMIDGSAKPLPESEKKDGKSDDGKGGGGGGNSPEPPKDPKGAEKQESKESKEKPRLSLPEHAFNWQEREELPKPTELVFGNPEQQPDFSKGRRVKDTKRGNMQMSYPSKNGEFEYLFEVDQDNRVCVSGIRDVVAGAWVNDSVLTLKTNSKNKLLKQFKVDGISDDQSVDAYDRYLKDIPVIRAFQKSQNIDPDSRQPEPKTEPGKAKTS